MKIIILRLLKILWIFKITKFMKRNDLLILAYHGFSIKDESSFSPGLFINPHTLEKRMRYLQEEHFHVLGLTEALEKLHSGSLPANSVVITADDGWFSTTHGNKTFSKYACPYTVYVSSYYVVNEVPVLNVAVRYMLWCYCNSHKKIDLHPLGLPNLEGTYSLLDSKEQKAFLKKLISSLDALQTTRLKIDFVRKIAKAFQFDYELLERDRILNFLSPTELHALSEQGVDIQLHTHRHRLPFYDEKQIGDEINDNRSHLSPYVKNKLHHFCYPSGDYTVGCEAILRNLGISSATTCDAGFVTRKTNLYYLPRFLDGEDINQLVFEAEVCGVLDIFRKIRRLLFRLGGK